MSAHYQMTTATPEIAGFPFEFDFDAIANSRPATDDRDALIESHYEQVWHVARSLARRLPHTVDVEDLVGAGTLGLVSAADRFSADRGITFKTYAESRIRGAMLDFLRELDWAPRRLRKEQRRVREATGRVEQTLGVCDDESVAGELGLSMGEYHGLRQALDSLSVVSLDAVVAVDGPVYEATDGRQSPLAQYEMSEQCERLAAAIDRLGARERQVIALSFVDELSLREIGEIFGVTESRISQIRTQALRSLKTLLAA